MSGKRTIGEVVNDDSDDDFGPMPSTIASNQQQTVEITQVEEVNESEVSINPKKKQKLTIPNHLQKIYLDNLPNAPFYEHSFMHRDTITHIAISKQTEFIITASIDGHVKFWKKMNDNIEFVKHFQAHLGPINCLSLSPDGSKLLTTSTDQMIKFFEVIGFDMSHMIKVDYIPTTGLWLGGIHGGIHVRIAVADASSGIIRIYRSDGSLEPINEIKLHSSPVKYVILRFISYLTL